MPTYPTGPSPQKGSVLTAPRGTIEEITYAYTITHTHVCLCARAPMYIEQYPCKYSIRSSCKTQNSGLRFKEEKPRDPLNQASRCNTQEGLLSVAQTGDSDLLGGRAHRTANWASFLYAKKTNYQHITYGLQSDWLHVCKAILLVQTSLATCLQSNPIGTNFAGFGSNLKQFYWYFVQT